MGKKYPAYKQVFIRLACIWPGLLLLSFNTASAGTSVDTIALYIAPNALFYVNNNSNLSVFSNVINSGMLGTVKGVTVNMFGDSWRNTATASFPDELGINNPNSFTGIGGTFRFGSIFPQYLAGGYSVTSKTGAAFPNLAVDNPRGVSLDENTDTHILNTLEFDSGLLWLNGNNLLIGGINPGSITGYTENRFIATGNTTQGGYLYRSKISSATGSVVFPIGTQAGSYAPVSVMFNTIKAQDLHVRVFDKIYTNAVIGRTGNPASVQQTWNIGQEDTAKVPAIVALQHMIVNEGAAFTAHRGNSYVSRYDFTRRAWDTLPPSGLNYPGTFTTGTPQQGAYINTRAFDSLGQNTYLTKTADTRTDSITLAKGALSPVREVDGSFRVTYVFLIKNAGSLTAHSLQVYDSLSKVFRSAARFSVSTVTASGNLVANNRFDGETITDLLQPASTLAPFTTDTVTLVLNVAINEKEAYYYNTASLKGFLNGFNGGLYVFNNLSVNGFTAPAPATKPIPTPVILSAAKYKLPHGFSPNGDGVNDKLVIGNLGNDNAAIWIFNKQGNLVYKSMNYHNDWDGYYYQNLGGQASNQKVEDGTYFYKAVITDATTGKQETYYGYISIWR